MKKLLANKDGFTKVQWCVLIVVMAIIMSFLLSYVATVSNAASQKEAAKNALDKYLEQNAIRIYSEVKQGSDYTAELFVDEYIEYLVLADQLTLETDRLVCYTPSGAIRYYMTIPQMDYQEDYSSKLIVTYTLSLPLEFNGNSVAWVNIPMTITSRFVPKFTTT